MLGAVGHRMGCKLAALWLSLSGRIAFAAGKRGLRLGRAKRIFLRLVDLDFGSFTGHLHLGLIAALEMEREAASRELLIACRIDARRFRRARMPRGLKARVLRRDGARKRLAPQWDRLAGATWGAEAASRAVRMKRVGPAEEMRVETHPGVGFPLHSDFSSGAEYARIKRLPPVSREEIAGCDIDDLLARLTESGA